MQEKKYTLYCVERSLFFLLAFTVTSKPKHLRQFGETLRVHRKKAGLTQEQLAEKADLHHNFIGAVERGEMEISLGSMVRISKALKISVQELVSGV